MKKISLWLGGIGGVVMAGCASLVAHAQSFSVSTSTEQTNNGNFLQIAYDHLINFLGPTGAVLFMVVIAILSIVVWMAVKTPRHVVSA